MESIHSDAIAPRNEKGAPASGSAFRKILPMDHWGTGGIDATNPPAAIPAPMR